MARKYKAAIFDLDGTLIDSLQDLYLSCNHALRSMGFVERTLDEVRQFVGNGVGKLIERATPEGTSEADVAETLSRFKAHYVDHCRDHTAPYAGILEMLQELRRKGIPTAIVSNKLQAGVDELSREHFQGLIDVSIGEHEGARRKPAPDMPNEAIARLGMQREDCLYVGDSDVDVLTAQNAHLDCVAVLWGFRDRAVLAQAGATQYAEQPADLLAWF